MRHFLLWWALLPTVALGQSLDSLHVMVDAEAVSAIPYVYRSFQEAVAHLKDGTSRDPMTVYIRPGVYWIDDPDDSEVRVGKDGREPFGMTVHGDYLRLIGLGEKPEDVVLASQRGQTQGAVGNFTMFDFWVKNMYVENMTMGNYCNVDLVYPLNPRLNRPKRSDAITQAHVGYVHGDSLIAHRVRFISRLNLNPLNGARYSYYEDCHFESTDDALNGTAIYRHCDFDFYGQKPFWSTFGRGAMFIDCDFYAKSNSRELYFTKQGGPVTVIDCRYHAPSDSVYIGWTAYPQPWLRCYQHHFTLNGKPYVIGNRQLQNTIQTNRLATYPREAPFLGVSQHEATLMTARDTLRLTCPEPVRWHVDKGFESYVALIPVDACSVAVVPLNHTDENADFCISATTEDGREAACLVTVKPSQLPPPKVRNPKLRITREEAILSYTLNAKMESDDSRITWYRDSIPVAASHGSPARSYRLQPGDRGHMLKAVITPKQKRSDEGHPISCQVQVERTPQQHTLETDFSHFYCDWQPVVAEGVWTVDGFKPADTSEYPWSFNSNKPMWEYAKGFNGAVGMGLLQAQRGARLRYTPVSRQYGDMSLELLVDPTKTAGQGFGSATGQYMDVCLKFDTRTLTGYGLRMIRTKKYANAVDFLLVRYDQGVVTEISAPVSATCYLTGCTISLHFTGNELTAHVTTVTPRPSGSQLPHEVSLKAQVPANSFGGVHIQHTGSCGESTTMLHRLKVCWH